MQGASVAAGVFAATLLVSCTGASATATWGTDDPPAQTPLDARPEPGSDTPDLDDAAFKQGDQFSDSGAGHTDNYLGPDGGNWVLDADCLSFSVGRLTDAPGPEVLQSDNYNLSADVTFRTSQRCGQFDYGNGHKSDGVPVADAPVPPTQEQRPQPAKRATTTTTPRPARPAPGAKPACKARSVKARGPLRSFRTPCPSFGAKRLTVTFRLKKSARVRVDLMKGSKLVRRVLKPRTRKARHTYTRRIAPKGLKAGRYTLRLRATRAHRTTTFKLRLLNGV